MSTARALYSVVQYVPDSGRAEGANAGVVLYVPAERSSNSKSRRRYNESGSSFDPAKPTFSGSTFDSNR
jgi:hypothetical protein